MKKPLLLVLVFALSIGLVSMAYAKNNTTKTNPTTKTGTQQKQKCPQLKLTDEQKAQFTSIIKQKLELQKQIIKDNVTNGTITEEQAQVMEGRMNTQLKAIESGEFTPCMGDCKMRNQGMNKEIREKGIRSKDIRGKALRNKGMQKRTGNGQCPLEQQQETT
jgi:carboxypeptidase C (cathepsin A)